MINKNNFKNVFNGLKLPLYEEAKCKGFYVIRRYTSMNQRTEVSPLSAIDVGSTKNAMNDVSIK